MSETEPKAEPKLETKGVTLLDAARALGVSEKTVRRRIAAGEIEGEKVPVEGGGLAWCVYLADNAVDSAVDNAPEVAGRRAGHATDNAPDTSTLAPEPEVTVPEPQRPNATAMTEARAGTAMANAPDNSRLQEMREEIQFLRGVIEQQQRSEAELRTALRTALAAMPKALTEATDKSDRQVLAEDGNAAPETGEFSAHNDEMGKVTGAAKPAPNSANVARQRGFRGWLLRILKDG